MFLPALAFLVILDIRGNADFGHHGTGHAALLATAGVATAVPLLFFAAAARRVPLTVMGLLQYLAPVLQFLTGVLLFQEAMPASTHAAYDIPACFARPADPSLGVHAWRTVRKHAERGRFPGGLGG